MKLFKWSEVPEEHLSETIVRKFIHGEKVMLAHFLLKKGCVVPTHSHESEQMSHILQGALKFNVGGEEIIVRAGEVLQIPSNVPHSALALEDCIAIDVFSPLRQDWLEGRDNYLRGA
jgi:quercetin dioxygenase-like cupin family protein